MKLFIPDDHLNEYHNFMIRRDMIGSYLLGFRLVAQSKSGKKYFFTLAFIDKDSVEEFQIWADLHNLTIDKKIY